MISNNEVTDALPCYMVNNVTINSAEQCKFIVDNGCLEDESTIDYVYLVYCEMGYELRYAAIVMIAFFVIVLFLNLSSVADEFLCPSLLSVAKNLRMSDSLAVSRYCERSHLNGGLVLITNSHSQTGCDITRLREWVPGHICIHSSRF